MAAMNISEGCNAECIFATFSVESVCVFVLHICINSFLSHYQSCHWKLLHHAAIYYSSTASTPFGT